jgi:hypothetical protein
MLFALIKIITRVIMYRKVIFLGKDEKFCNMFLKFEKLEYFKIVKNSKIKVPGTILKKYNITLLAPKNAIMTEINRS